MTLWRYRAADADSELREGEIEAPDEAAAVERLHVVGLMPLRLRPRGRGDAPVSPVSTFRPSESRSSARSSRSRFSIRSS